MNKPHATQNGTAQSPGDYTAKTGAVTIAAGQTSATFTISIAGDTLAESSEAFTVLLSGASGASIARNSATVTIADDDRAGFTFSRTSGLVTTEAGGTDTFTVRLTSQPSANVSFGLTSSDTTEGTVSPSTCTFTPTNWSTPQTFTLTGQDDALVDGDKPYTIVTSAATSTDADYSGLAVPDVSATHRDNEQAPSAALTLSVSPTTFAENAGPGAATATLSRSGPTTSSVTVTLSSSDTTEATVPATWPINAGVASTTFTVGAVNDTLVDGTQSVTLSASATGLTGATATVNVTDDEAGGLSAATGLVATGKYKKIVLRWDYVQNAASYSIRRSTSASIDGTEIGTVDAPATTYTDGSASLVIGTTYYYRVVAVNGNQSSAPSNQASATSLPPFEILNLSNGDVMSGYATIKLSLYTDVDFNDIKVFVDGGFVAQVLANDAQSTSATLPIRTERFASGAHTIKMAYRSGYEQTRTVTFANDVFNLKYDPILNSGTASPSARIRADLVSAQDWAVKIKDYGGIVVRTLNGSGSSIDVTWDGTNDAGVPLPDATYALSISLLGTTASSAQRSLIVAAPPVTASISKQSNRMRLPLPQVAETTGLGTTWKVVIRNSMGDTIRTFMVERAKSTRTILNWDGMNESGEAVPNGYYSVTFTRFKAKPGKSVPSRGGSIKPTDVGGAGHYLDDCPMTKDKIKDSLIVLSLDVFPGGMSSALEYAQFIESRVAARRSAFSDAPSVMIVDGSNASLNSSGTPEEGNSQINPSATSWISIRLTAAALKLLYVDSHGETGTKPGGFGFPEQIPYFGIGNHQWFSKNLPEDNGLYGLYTSHELPKMVAPFSYGQNADPPRLVWIDACDSFGQEFDAFGNAKPDEGFAQAFGIAGTADNGYSEGVALGWFGQIPQYGTDATWQAWRQQFWDQMFRIGRNFQTSLANTDSIVQPRSAVNPQYKHVYSGVGTTAF